MESELDLKARKAICGAVWRATNRTVDLGTMPGPGLVKRESRLAAVSSDVCKALILDGHGLSKGSEIRALAKDTGEQLARAYVAIEDSLIATRDEMKSRQRYSGTFRPIKR
jgi:hypothetical protein